MADRTAAAAGAASTMEVEGEELANSIMQEAVASMTNAAEEKQSKKKKMGTSRLSSSDKISAVHMNLDVVSACAALLENQAKFVESIRGDINDPTKMNTNLNVLAKSSTFLIQTLKQQVNVASKSLNNTSAKKQSKAIHRKLTKHSNYEEAEKQMERQVNMHNNPRKIFGNAVKEAEERVKSTMSLKLKSSTIVEHPGEMAATRKIDDEIIQPRKRTKTTAGKPEEEEEIRLARPADGRLLYTPMEAARIGLDIMNDNTTNRAYKKRAKEKMIALGRVPVKMTQLNDIIKKLREGKSINEHWNMKGPQEIMRLDELVTMHHTHTQQHKGRGWSEEDTKAALVAKLKADLDTKGLDSSNVKEPTDETVQAYHGALEEAAGLTKRACASKNTHREAGETSERNMLSTVAGVVNMSFYVAQLQSVPLTFRFDEKLASPGAIKARDMYAKAHGVPLSTVHPIDPSMITNQDDVAAIYSNFKGDGSCNGNPDQSKTMLVDREAANDPSYGLHCSNDTSQQFDGIKVRVTNMIAASGHYASAFVQVLNFSEAEMPVDKVPNGIIVLEVRGLSPDGGVNPHSQTSGFLVLVRKGTNIETEMFRLHSELVAEPFVDILRSLSGYPAGSELPAYLRAMITFDGGVPQLKAMQDEQYLKKKVLRKEELMKIARNTSGVAQACDTGVGHKLFKHYMHHLSDIDTPSVNMIAPLTESIQALRDEGKLIVSANKKKLIIRSVIRLPTVLQKSFSSRSVFDSFVIPGFIDQGRQGPDIDKLFHTYKKQFTVAQREKWELDLTNTLIKSWAKQGCLREQELADLGYGVDTDGSGNEHLLPEDAFTTQHHRQRTTNLTNSTVMSRFTGANDAAIENERARLLQVQEQRWRVEELRLNEEYEAELHKNAGRDAGSDRALLMDDNVDEALITFVATLRGKCKSFVRARGMLSKQDPNWKEPSHVGANLVEIQTSLFKVEQGHSLTKKEDSWCLRAIQLYKQPIVLEAQVAAPNPPASVENEQAVLPALTALSRTLVVNTHQCQVLASHPFIENASVVTKLKECLMGSNILESISSSMLQQVDALVQKIPLRLQTLVDSLPESSQHSWVFAAMRDNIHSVAQILTLLGQVGLNVEGATINTCLLRPPSMGYYARPLESNSKHYQGVILYYDGEAAKIRCSFVVHGKDKSFEKRYAEDLKKSKTLPPPSTFYEQYPYEKPTNAEQGGWTGTFGDLRMIQGIAFDSSRGNNDCLTCRDSDGVFVWSNRTMTKLEESNNVQGTIKDKQLKLVCCMFELAYNLMMDPSDTIIEGAPFKQFLGPVQMN